MTKEEYIIERIANALDTIASKIPEQKYNVTEHRVAALRRQSTVVAFISTKMCELEEDLSISAAETERRIKDLSYIRKLLIG